MKWTKTFMFFVGIFGLILFFLGCDENNSHTMIQLTYDEINATNPVWSPLGDTIFFSGLGKDGWGIWTIDSQGGNLNLFLSSEEIGPNTYNLDPYDYSDDGYLIFTAKDKIYYISLAASEPVFICDGSRPTIKGNLDGNNNIAYVCYDYEETGIAVIFLTDIHGSYPQLVISNANYPHWSPDGSMIAFTRANPPQLYTIDVTTQEVTILYDGIRPSSPRWSPGGEWIAFAEVYEGTGKTEVYIIPAKGGVPNRLTVFPYDPELDLSGASSPFWSPDGKWIVYCIGGGELWKVSVE